MPDPPGLEGVKVALEALKEFFSEYRASDNGKWTEVFATLRRLSEGYAVLTQVVQTERERNTALEARVARLESQREQVAWKALNVLQSLAVGYLLWRLTQ